MGRLTSWLGVAVVAIAAVGCSSKPATMPVSGRVTLDGTPLDCGGLLFQPEKGMASRGAIGADGRFALTGSEEAVIGRNTVAVACYESDKPGYSQPMPGEPATGRSLVPEKYVSTSTSGLTVDVKPGMGEVVLELRTK